MKKRLLLITVLSLALACLCAISVFADTESESFYADEYLKKGSPASVSELAQKVDIDKFTAYLRSEIMNCSADINLKAYPDGETINLPNDEKTRDALKTIIFEEIYDAVHLDLTIGFRSTNTRINGVVLNYLYTADEVAQMLEDCDREAEMMLVGIKGNDSLSDLEKALLIHDRIALRAEYDIRYFDNGSEPLISHTMYGIFANKVAVCQGYARAYRYLLDKVGIESYLASSDQIAHEWNVVVIGGKKYHVDVTWDDPLNSNNTWNRKGLVDHSYFLCSSEVFSSSHYGANDFDMTPDDTAYDSAFFKDVDSEFVFVNGEIYYREIETGNVKNMRTGEVVFTISDATTSTGQTKWRVSATSYYSGIYSYLATDGKYIFFNTTGAIWKLDPKTGSVEKLTDTQNDTSGFVNVYGLAYEYGVLVYDVSNSPNFIQQTGRYTYEYQGDKVAVALSVEAYPKNQYVYGEALDTQGLVLRLSYYDGSYISVSEGYSVQLDSVLPGERNVIVSCGDLTTSYKVYIDKAQQTLTFVPAVEKVTATSVTFVLTRGIEYSPDGQTWQDGNVFDGLDPAKSYTFYARYKETDTYYAGQSSGTDVKTDKSQGSEINAPQVETKTDTSVVLYSIDGAEYSLDGQTWQDGGAFYGLKPGREYRFYARYKETETSYAGPASDTYVTTDKAQQNGTVAPVLISKTDTTVTLEYEEGAEYSYDGGEWQDSNVFTGLTGNTEYVFYARYKETDTQYAGQILDPLSVVTDKTELDISVVVRGNKKAGETLTAEVSGVPAGESYLIEWYVDGIKTDVSGSAYVLSEADEGKYLKVTVTLNGNCSGYTEAGFRIPVEGETVWGDSNSDGKVSSSDIVRLKKYFAGLDPDTGISTVSIGEGADANGDGKISSSDIVRLKKYFAGLDPDTGLSTVTLGPKDPTNYVAITYENYSVDSVIPYSAQKNELQTIPRGSEEVVTQGQNGLKRTYYRKVFENGVYIEDEFLREETVTAPVTEVKNVGVGGTFVSSDGITYSFSYYMTVQATCYGYAEGFTGHTATGQQVRQGIMAVDPTVIPYHTKCFATCPYMEYGVCQAEDCGGGIKGNKIDLYFDENYTLQDMYNFGRRNMTLYIDIAMAE